MSAQHLQLRCNLQMRQRRSGPAASSASSDAATFFASPAFRCKRRSPLSIRVLGVRRLRNIPPIRRRIEGDIRSTAYNFKVKCIQKRPLDRSIQQSHHYNGRNQGFIHDALIKLQRFIQFVRFKIIISLKKRGTAHRG